MRDLHRRDALTTALDTLGESWNAVHVVPFSPVLPELPAGVDPGAVICLGASFVPRVADSAWRPGIFFDVERFRWSAMRAAWADWMLSDDARLCTLGEVLEELADGGERFVRPDADSKSFDGGVYDAATLALRTRAVDRAIAVVAASPRPIDAEWRCIVVAGKIVDGSEYRRAGRRSVYRGVPPAVADLVELAAARWTPAEVVCIDAASSGPRFGIVEANCFSAAGLYAADPVTVLGSIAEHVGEP